MEHIWVALPKCVLYSVSNVIYIFLHTIFQIYMSCIECEIRAVATMQSTSMSLLPRCSQAPTKRHGSPVEVVLSGSEAALLGLVEILKSPDVGHRY